ncbi:hypothetical protein M513_07810 [Trichuris suis]|uniref:Uncharacterized protein n=1 Tax=Trichuris suis TaxID=68888 RepID=A0A085M2F9_9BILA|nr:hypothetical protein M513_07810 [Trichuris suis]
MKTKSPVKGDPRDMHSETCSGLGCARRRLTGGDGLDKIYIAGRTPMEMMRSGTCEKETDQRRQTRENIWPHTNGNVPGRKIWRTKEARGEALRRLEETCQHESGSISERKPWTHGVVLAQRVGSISTNAAPFCTAPLRFL